MVQFVGPVKIEEKEAQDKRVQNFKMFGMD